MALADPTEAHPPLSKRTREGMRRMAPVKELRWRLNMSREEFSAANGIPLGDLKAWERRTAEPTETEAAYSGLFERDPEHARRSPA